MSTKAYIDLIESRRSIYALGAESTLSDEEIVKLVGDVTDTVPSAFNSQSPRIMVLFGDNHKKLWSIVLETLRKIATDPERFKATEAKVAGFAAAYGTVLYFQDNNVIKGLQESFPGYAHHFPRWGDQANGIILFGIWSALTAAGMGANIQHYNPIIDDEVKATFGVPASWELIGQMPFGKILEPAGPKEGTPLAERLIVKN